MRDLREGGEGSEIKEFNFMSEYCNTSLLLLFIFFFFRMNDATAFVFFEKFPHSINQEARVVRQR